MNAKNATQPAADEDALLITNEVAALLRVSPRQAKRLIKLQNDPLPSIRLPGIAARRFRRSQVLAWIERGHAGAAHV